MKNNKRWMIVPKKFQAPRGTRDFLPEEMILREKVFDTVKRVFKKWGFDPFKTPAFENYELFTMKDSIGEGEANKLYIFEDKSKRKLALRFDQTVPFARQVTNNPQLPKPIKRWEISRVWRYEETKKGRYREFWQCDVDTVGSKDMIADAEIIGCTLEVLRELGFDDCYMRINNRKLLSAILQYSGISKDKITDVFRDIDKLDKIGIEGVRKELKKDGIQEDQVERIVEIIGIKGNAGEVLEKAEGLIGDIKIGKEGVEELKKLVGYLKKMGIENVKVDMSLVRGLDYYTSTIFEAMSSDKKIGSLAGGGRYDKMIASFSGEKGEVPAVGVGIGTERIIDLLKERVGAKAKTSTRLFVVNVNEKVFGKCLELAQEFRKAGISTQVNLMEKPLSKQLEYANSLGIPFAVIVGEKEIEAGKYKLKNMESGEEKQLKVEEIIKKIIC
jgi:histidyl-tRNA synthetase